MRSTSAPDAASGVAAAFAARLGALARAPLPAAVAHEAKRALVNVLALAAGASRHPGVDAIVAAARELGGAPDVPIPGRTDRLDAHFAALAAGFAAHVDDFDDTHLATVIHPGAACMAVLVALAPETRAERRGGAARVRGRMRGAIARRRRDLARALRPRL